PGFRTQATNFRSKKWDRFERTVSRFRFLSEFYYLSTTDRHIFMSLTELPGGAQLRFGEGWLHSDEEKKPGADAPGSPGRACPTFWVGEVSSKSQFDVGDFIRTELNWHGIGFHR